MEWRIYYLEASGTSGYNSSLVIRPAQYVGFPSLSNNTVRVCQLVDGGIVSAVPTTHSGNPRRFIDLATRYFSVWECIGIIQKHF